MKEEKRRIEKRFEVTKGKLKLESTCIPSPTYYVACLKQSESGLGQHVMGTNPATFGLCIHPSDFDCVSRHVLQSQQVKEVNILIPREIKHRIKTRSLGTHLTRAN